MSEKRSTKNTLIYKGKEGVEERFYAPANNLSIIYHCEFYEQLLLICTKTNIVVYNSVELIRINESKKSTHTASFIPNTNCIAYASQGEEAKNKNVMVIWDYKVNEVICKMTFTFQIELIKASRRCILLSSSDQLYVLHFPSLKPIYNGHAGNGFRIICDISRQGLTLAFNSEKKGQVVVKNFTNMKTNKLLVDIRSQSRKMSMNSRIKSRNSKQDFIVEQQNEEEIKHEISIMAHKQSIIIIRLSPNGFRLVSGSIKGTVIRLYSCLNGELLSEYLMCSELCSIIDINFISQGNGIACLNQMNQVNIFHTKISQLELISETARRGCEIYEQENPKSAFSFLGFINQNLRYEQPFSYFLLSTKAIELKEKQLQKKQISPSKLTSKNDIIQIVEEPAYKQTGDSAVGEGYTEQILTVHTKTVSQQINISEIADESQNQSVNAIKITVNPAKEKTQLKQNLHRSSSYSRKKTGNGSMKSVNLLNRKQSELVVVNKTAQKSINFRGVIYFDDTTNVKILRSKYFYRLKYDPFNGGQMVESDSFSLLNHPIFKDL